MAVTLAATFTFISLIKVKVAARVATIYTLVYTTNSHAMSLFRVCSRIITVIWTAEILS